MKAKVEQINETILQVEECDPFVKDVFGVSGMGEGLVYVPINTNPFRDVNDPVFVD